MIRLIVTDVDGVLTDGSILIDDNGVETKRFNVLDGSAVAHLRHVHIPVAIITGRRSRATLWRARECQITEVHQGHRDKLRVLQEVCTRLDVPLDETAYIGDDLLDLAPLLAVGLACCPADARPEVQDRCQVITRAKGGEGVLRDVAEFVLRQNGQWEGVLARYLPTGAGEG
ncbi:MAG: KdsC family phosphatase [Planctomycetota bacterium]